MEYPSSQPPLPYKQSFSITGVVGPNPYLQPVKCGCLS